MAELRIKEKFKEKKKYAVSGITFYKTLLFFFFYSTKPVFYRNRTHETFFINLAREQDYSVKDTESSYLFLVISLLF